MKMLFSYFKYNLEMEFRKIVENNYTLYISKF